MTPGQWASTMFQAGTPDWYLMRDIVEKSVKDKTERIIKLIENNADDGCPCCERVADELRKGLKP